VVGIQARRRVKTHHDTQPTEESDVGFTDNSLLLGGGPGGVRVESMSTLVALVRPDRKVNILTTDLDGALVWLAVERGRRLGASLDVVGAHDVKLFFL
jgi:hypothetical protein